MSSNLDKVKLDKVKLDKVKKLIATGSEMAGAASGAVMASLIVGPVGAAAGGAAGVVICTVLSDVAHRYLSQREETRIGTAVTFAIQNIQRRLEIGEHLRDDGFFQFQQNASRTSAEEILEGVLSKSKNEHEEKKVRIFGNIFANIAFTPGLEIGEANHILKTTENLTYRQMCLLASFHRKDEIRDLKFAESLHNSQSFETISILQEIYQLHNSGLLACRVPDSSDYQALLSWDDVKPNLMELTSLAKRYYVIMGLDEVSSIDFRDVAIHLVVE